MDRDTVSVPHGVTAGTVTGETKRSFARPSSMRTVLGVAAEVLFTISLQQELGPVVASPWHIGHVGPASAMPRAQTNRADTGDDRVRSIASDVTATAARPERLRTDAAERIDG